MKANRKNLFLFFSRLISRAAFAAISLGAVQAQTTGNWNYNGTVTASNSWNTAASWASLTGGLVPNAIGATANFSALNTTAARTITLDGDKIVGTMSVEDLTPNPSYQPYTFNAGTPTTSKLIFDVDSGSAALSTPTGASAANHTINPPIQLNDPLVITTTRTNTGGGTYAGGSDF